MINNLDARNVATILTQADRESGCGCEDCLVRHAYHEVMDSAQRAIIDASGGGSLTTKLKKHLFPKG